MTRLETRLVKMIEQQAAESAELHFISLPTSSESHTEGDVEHLVGPFHSRHIAAHMASWSHATINGGEHLHITSNDRKTWAMMNEMPDEFNIRELKVRRLSQMKRGESVNSALDVTVELLIETWCQKVIENGAAYMHGRHAVLPDENDVKLATELAYELKWSTKLPENYFGNTVAPEGPVL